MDLVVGMGTCSTISMPKPCRAGTWVGLLVSRRILRMPRSERIWPPRPTWRRMRWSAGRRVRPPRSRAGRGGSRGGGVRRCGRCRSRAGCGGGRRGRRGRLRRSRASEASTMARQSQSGGAEDVAGEAVGVDADEDGLVAQRRRGRRRRGRRATLAAVRLRSRRRSCGTRRSAVGSCASATRWM